MSDFNINKFKEHFRQGGARPNLFKVSVSAFGIGLPAADKLVFTCRAASIPAMTVGNIDVSYQGRKVKVAGDRTFAEWQITVYNDEDWLVRSAFEKWNNAINLHADNVRAASHYNLSDYKFNINVEQLNKKADKIAEYTLIGAYPSEVAAIDLAMDTNDTISEFSVTFQYDYFTSDSTPQGVTVV